MTNGAPEKARRLSLSVLEYRLLLLRSFFGSLFGGWLLNCFFRRCFFGFGGHMFVQG
jgi:hypothetical protein